jgi:hypothetical protein
MRKTLAWFDVKIFYLILIKGEHPSYDLLQSNDEMSIFNIICPYANTMELLIPNVMELTPPKISGPSQNTCCAKSRKNHWLFQLFSCPVTARYQTC